MAGSDSDTTALPPPHLRALRRAAASADAAAQDERSSAIPLNNAHPRTTWWQTPQIGAEGLTIREKLSTLGVKVDVPMPWTRPAPGGQPSAAATQANTGHTNDVPPSTAVSELDLNKQIVSLQRGSQRGRGSGRGRNRSRNRGSTHDGINGSIKSGNQGGTHSHGHRGDDTSNKGNGQGRNRASSHEGNRGNTRESAHTSNYAANRNGSPVTGRRGNRGGTRDGLTQTSNNDRGGSFVAGRGRGRGASRGGFARSSGWPKHKDIPKGDPTRFELTWADWESQALSTIDSAVADPGIVGGRRHHPQVDAESGFQLGDWAGNWAPAPVDWDARPAFRNHQSAQLIERWLDKIDEEMRGVERALPMLDVTLTNGSTLYFAPDPKREALAIQGEPAPRYWIPGVLGKQTASMFWAETLLSKTPMPLEDDDLVDVRPWWERYEMADSRKPCAFLRAYPSPLISGIDPDENEAERLARENDMGSAQHTDNRRRFERAKTAAARERKQKQQERARQAGTTPAQPADRIKTGIKLYVRTAGPEDINDILQIYNYYIENSISVPETRRLDESAIQRRLRDANTNRLPLLVACQRGQRVKARGKGTGEDIILPDSVVGFAAADDFHDRTSMYRFTADLDFYTRHDVLMKGVAKCLVDKLITMLDPHYMSKGGYEVRGSDIDGIGAGRYVQNLVVHLPYDTPERLEWTSKWLSRSYGFKKVGDLTNIGIKDGKRVSLAIFQRATGVEIDPANAPFMDYPAA